MQKLLARWGSTLIVWSFLVTGVTGVLLFYRVHAPPTEILHIWIGMLMLAAFIPHVARNWKSFLGYFRKTPTYVALVLTVVISAFLAYPAMTGTQERGGPPGIRSLFAVSEALGSAPVGDLAPLLDTDGPGVVARLEQLGVSASGPEVTLKEAAQASGKNVNEVLGALFSASHTPAPDGAARPGN